MSDKTFIERFPGFKETPPGKAAFEILDERFRKRLRSLVSDEDQISRGAVQELHRVVKEIFGIDLME
jgi:hypothetical protein